MGQANGISRDMQIEEILYQFLTDVEGELVKKVNDRTAWRIETY